MADERKPGALELGRTLLIAAIVVVLALIGWRIYRAMKPWELTPANDAPLEYAEENR